ncbi:HlyD family efflux transporter periplasmic adaptor subunit [bacterium]|nr:HlyD family efflux transporter periplasmic adaptor subunit [bacterium]
MSSALLRNCLLAVALIGTWGCKTAEDGNAIIGYVEGEYIYISSPQTGLITSTTFELGDIVSRGDTLFALENELETLMYEEARGRTAQARAQAENLYTGARPEELAALDAKLQEAKAQLTLAQAEYDRKYPLVEKEILAAAEGDALIAALTRAKASVRSAEEAITVAKLGGRDAAKTAAEATEASAIAALRQTEWKLNRRIVRATVPGAVEMVFHRQGEFVSTGAPVLAILPPDNIKVRFFVSQELVSTIQLGQTVQFKPDGIGEAVSATVSFIAKEAEFTPPVIYSKDARQKLVFMVEAHLPQGVSLRPGLPVDVTLK